MNNTDKTIKVKKGIAEQDITIVLPNKKEIVVQYRNYEGDQDTGEGASIDVLLPGTSIVHNWIGRDMEPAQQDRQAEQAHIRIADQIMFIVE